MTAPFEDDEGEQELLHNPVVKVAEFEGGYVTQMRGRIPAITIPMQSGYRRDTHVRLNVEVRVKSVRYDEIKGGALLRDHIFEVVSAQAIVAIAPEDLGGDDVSGSASAYPLPDPEVSEELGVEFRRSSDQWNRGAAGF